MEASTTQYVYDVFNHRIHVQTPSATNEYIYDYAGRRISTWLSPNNSGSEGRIYWDGQQICLSFDGWHDLLRPSGHAGHGADADDILRRAVGSSYISLPWGDGYTATVNTSGADQDNEHFAGLDRDAESGTEHAQFRNYASVQGRWLAPDSYLGSYDLDQPAEHESLRVRVEQPHQLG